MALNIDLSIDGVSIPKVNGIFVLDNLEIFDFGRTFQIKITNKDNIPLKDHYVMIVSDSSLNVVGTRCASLSHANGSGITQDKLFLLNNNMTTNAEEIFQLIFTFPYGVNSTENMTVGLAISNHVVNTPTFTP